MTEPTIVCPKCRSEIKLTESLAAPLLEATRKEHERRMREKDEAAAAREVELRTKIAADEARKAKQVVATDLDQKTRDVAELREVLAARDAKLAEAQKAQADFVRKERALEDQKRELELTIEKRVNAAREADLQAARTRAQDEVRPKVEEMKLQLTEREEKIASMQRQIEALMRKAEQGSQQAQGEAQEMELEALLAARFPRDSIEPVAKGESGADCLQRVMGPAGQACGAILWESKRTKNWSDGWLTKLKDDQRAAKAEVAVLMSHALPKGVDTFELLDGVWVTHPRAAVPLAMVLRQTLIEVALVRQASEGQDTKMELVYRYLTGPRFFHRLQAIVEAFSSMQSDLASEKRAIMTQWKKREAQIERMTNGTVSLYGELQAIVGKSLKEIEGLEMGTLSLPFDAGPSGGGDDPLAK